MKGHGFYDHDLAVAQVCTRIHEDESAVKKAWVAALLHSLDRFMEKEEEKETIEKLLSLVPFDLLSEEDRKEIRVALENHDKFNGQEDSLVQIILQDADRVANAMAIVIPRSGQLCPAIPAIELEYLETRMNPGSTYRKPLSVHDDLFGVLEWDKEGPQAFEKVTLRLPLSVELGRIHFQYIRGWMDRVREDFTSLGLHPWPIE